jgi:hypothetical protein
LGAIWQKNGGGAPKKRHFFSCFFEFLGVFAPQKVEAEDFPPIRPLQKNRAKKPAVGFWFSTVSGNIAE